MGCRTTTTATPDAPPRLDWKRAADGIGLCVFSGFLLLNTTGLLPWSFWFDAIALWPLMIMSLGIQIAFEKSRAPWLVLLGPALMLAGLGWVASGTGPDLPAGPWKSEAPLPRPEGAQRLKLELKIFGSRLSVEARELQGHALVDARSIEQMLESHLRVEQQDDTALVHLETTRHRGRTFTPSGRQLWDLGVPTDLPLRLELSGAMNRSQLDLAHGRFEGGTIDGAFLATQLTLPAVAEPVKLVQKGAFNALRLSVPDGTPVKVTGNGFPFNVGKRNLAGEPGRAGYEVRIEGVFSAIQIEKRPERPKPEAEPHKPASPAPVHG